MQDIKSITYWNRAGKREEVELVYGDSIMRWLYGSKLGQTLTNGLFTKHLVSKLYGAYQSTPASQSKIQPFIEKFGINMQEYEPGPFKNFNDFFIRQFKPGTRTFVRTPDVMPAFAEARYLAFEKVNESLTFPVKGEHLTALALLEKKEVAESFKGGPLLIARLCPVDYHRFHFPDEGEVVESYRIPGPLHSVNPMALRFKSDILCTNERHVSILDTKNFGRIAYVEVGALCVGKIVQTRGERTFKRGDEKGYFLFGASTVVVLGQPGRWKPDSDLVEQTHKSRETFVKLGDRVAHT